MRYTSLDQINWSQAAFINYGTFQLVYRLNKHVVIKVGFINDEYELDKFQCLITKGLAPKVYGVFTTKRVDLPKKVRDDLYWFLPQHRDSIVRIVVMQYAKPIEDFSPYVSVYRRQCMQNEIIRAELIRKVAECNVDWIDDHTGNIGKIGNRYVVLDM